ncbi:3-oxoacyl-ACP synthase [Streptomyces albofaciens JCM 4342]|uniref:beta-ketoacyl synthase N-terminal-like domain-containing protein n=1 Tax=Streptomyces albofaciens TaxID=66866 RepID=UPI00123C5CC4|nr:beta-ketoacyl synthase N-terminal-like domain-containing protein [Streptomyces albofaciens]KAA6214898.1 3-oxoacyl-ACP synthase [Streptomyces albofaciens JCM 4342]
MPVKDPVNDIVISGLGLVTPFGAGVAPFWRGLLEGRSALRPAGRFEAPSYRGEPVGEVPGPGPAAGTPRKSAYARAAIGEAVEAAGLPGVPRDALVILVGQAPYPGPETVADAASDPAAHREFLGPDPAGALGPAFAPGRVLHLSHACASAVFAVGFAREALRAGVAPLAVVAGSSVLNRYEYASMDVVRAVGREAARPFDTGRAGISLGEGGGAVVLEPAGHARARGHATDLVVAGAACRVAGAKAAASDAELIAGCMRDALADAGADRLDHVHAHATGTVQGDAAELAAVESIAAETGSDALPVTSHKGAIGHLLHISGAPALAAAALTLRTGTVPPTAGLTAAEGTDRVVLPTAPLRLPSARTAAVNSFGFGGNNATLVLRGV